MTSPHVDVDPAGARIDHDRGIDTQSAVRYLGIEVGDALERAERTEC